MVFTTWDPSLQFGWHPGIQVVFRKIQINEKNSLGKLNIAESDIIRRNHEEMRWDSNFTLDDKFHVAALRRRIDWAAHLIPDGAFTWSKWIPNKVICFV